MNTPYQMLIERGNGKLQFGFYTSKGELFAYGNSTKMIFFEKLGEEAEYVGELPKMLQPEELASHEKVEPMTCFLIALCELERAGKHIRELENQLADL